MKTISYSLIRILTQKFSSVLGTRPLFWGSSLALGEHGPEFQQFFTGFLKSINCLKNWAARLSTTVATACQQLTSQK